METIPSPSPPASASSGDQPGGFAIGSGLFLRGLAAIHISAFLSCWVQLDALIGPRGLLPATRYFSAVREQIGAEAWRQLPSLCWIFGAGSFLHVLCAVGVLLSLLLFAGVAPALCLAGLWAAYLSLSAAGQIFFSFQWDTLLLEATLLAILLAPWRLLPLWRPHEPPRLARLLIAWLLFRLIFLAGVVKLNSGDPTWRDLSALTFHYETQPLPTPLGWWVHQLPDWVHRAACAGMFVIELVAPFLLFASRHLRHGAALLIMALMAAIALTGNYTFFNLLTAALCLPCLDDAWWRRLAGILPPLPALLRHLVSRLPRHVPPPPSPHTSCNLLGYTFPGSDPSFTYEDATALCNLIGDTRSAAGRTRWWVLAGITAGIFGYTLVQAAATLFPSVGTLPGVVPLTQLISPFRSLNNYGLFAVMTNPRPELIFEGSNDGRNWLSYEFPHKPGDLSRRPTWVAPHQPRLDWQLWFAALGPAERNPWVLGLCEHILRGNAVVLSGFAHNPFPEKPPRLVRVVRYEYHFTDLPTRRRTGQWWRRTPLDFYVAPASLR